MRKTREYFSILHYALVKNASQLYSRVFTHKPYQNANPTHSVILDLREQRIPKGYCLSLNACGGN